MIVKLLDFIDNYIMSGRPVETKPKKGFFSCCSGEEEKGNVYVDLNNRREPKTNTYVPPPPPPPQRITSLNQLQSLTLSSAQLPSSGFHTTTTIR